MRHIIVCGLGTISRELIAYLSTLDYEITVVTRNPQKATKELETDVTAISWDEIKQNPQIYFKNCLAVINLARPSIGSLAHPTFNMDASQLAKEKEAFKAEGASTTSTMAKLCADYGTPGETVFLNASSYNHYNSHINPQDPPYSDLNPPPNDNRPQEYLTEAMSAWEDAAKPASDAGIRVVHLGFGMLVDQNSTGFSKIYSLFQLGIGGRIGSGEQQIPMITMRDVLSCIVHCIHHSNLSGYVNIAGFSVKQKELAQELAQQVDARPLLQQEWMYIILKGLLGWSSWFNNITKPEPFIKLALGIFGEELLLKGLSIQSDKLAQTSFQFQDSSIEKALRYALGKPKDQLVSTEIMTSSYSQMHELNTEHLLRVNTEQSVPRLQLSNNELEISIKSQTSISKGSIFATNTKLDEAELNTQSLSVELI